MNDILIKAEEKMKASITNLENKFSTLRVGRATTSLVDGVLVNCYGSMMGLSSVATVVVADAHQLKVTPFDKSTLAVIEKAIFEADLGLTPNNNGECIFITIPPLTEERRKELVKQSKTMTEEAKVSLRNVRQDANTSIKNAEASIDEKKNLENNIQELTNKYNLVAEEKYKIKEKELMTV